MDSDSDNVAENEKYAFLLGSALRNEDTDQFFRIYDRILPKDLTDSQIDTIKDRARKIADLCEEEFNCLVSRARNFSLAPSTMSVSTRPDSKQLRYCSEEEEDEGVGSAKYKSDTSSLYSSHTARASLRSTESDTRRCDEDSGVCNSSKATNSIDSLSDPEASESEERGCYDYFPPTQVKIHSGGGLHLDYDEAHDVQSDRSSQDVNSPRSDIDIEMTTYRSDQNHDRDFYTDEESDEEQNVHKKMYGTATRSYRGYTLMQKESTEEYTDFSPNFESSKLSWTSGTQSRLRSQVDDKIPFSTLGHNVYSRHNNSYSRSESRTSSDKVKIEKNCYTKTGSKPPFGDGQDQLEKVTRSIQPLLGHINDTPVPNMPEARKLVQLTSEDNKRKKKKKKVPKDELAEKYDKDSLNGQRDENGNPLETIPLIPTGYRQMRDSSSLGHRGAVTTSKSTYGTNHTFPQKLDHFDIYPHNNHQIKDLADEDPTSSSKKRKRKKFNKEKIIKAEEIDNYKGDTKDIDELVNFIAGNNEGIKKTKKQLPPSITTAITATDIPGKGEKNIKKPKDKKQKSPAPASSAEEKETKEECIKKNNSEEKDTGLSKSELDSEIGGSTDCSQLEMGNSGAKSECDPTENCQGGGTITVYDKKKLANLLKDNDEIESLSLEKTQSLMISNPVNDLHSPENETLFSKKDKKGDPNQPTTIQNMSDSNKSEENRKMIGKGGGKASKTDKVESSANQRVKQKNAKNSKSKPLNTSVPVCSESSVVSHPPLLPLVVDAMVNEAHGADVVNSELIAGLDPFIFTDIGFSSVPQENEFRVVEGKKKKKTKDIHIPTPAPPKRGFCPHHPGLDDKPAAYAGGIKVSSRQIRITAVSAAVDTDRLRDLSPSAFPALENASSKRRKSLPDGRRNSTGEVPIPSEVSGKHLQDDSDIESVKSLPAAGLMTNKLNLESPRPIVSYASITASPRPPGSKSSNQASPLPLSSEEKEEMKSQVWKGSPTERRHSIGSKPDDKSSSVKDNNSPSRRGRCGSSEALVMEDDRAGKFPGEEIDLQLNKTKSSIKGIVGEGITDSVNAGTANIIAKDCAVINVSSSHSLSTSSSQTSLSSNNGKSSSTTSLKEGPSEKELHKEQKPSVQKLKVNNSHKQEIIKTVTTKTSNNNKKLKQKSVIFLDRKVAEIPENLGITFGYEPGAEKNDVQSVKIQSPSEKVLDDFEVQNNESNAAVGILDVKPSASSLVTQPHENSPSISTSSKSAPIVIKQKDNSNMITSKQDSSKPQTDSKISHLRGINGVVQPSAQGPSLHTSSKPDTSSNGNSSLKINKALGDQQISSDSDHSKQFENRKGAVTVSFGENVFHVKGGSIPDCTNNGPSQCCGHIGFIPETGDIKANSSIVDVTYFLQKEWERVMQQKDKDPSGVTIFSG